MQHSQNKPDFSQIISNNPFGYILRTNLSKETGGILHGRTMANLDSHGDTGIQGRITIGRKVAYPVQSVVEYLQSKVTVAISKKDESITGNDIDFELPEDD